MDFTEKQVNFVKKNKKNDCLFLVVWFLQSRTSNNCLQHDSV